MYSRSVRFYWYVLLVVSVLVSGCQSAVSGLAVAGPGRLECGRADAPLWTLPTMVRGMPRVAVPVPPGWSSPPGELYVLPVDPPRGAGLTIGNPSLKVAGYVPTLLVNIDSFELNAPGLGDTEQRGLDELIADIAHSSRIIARRSGLVCGHPSVTVQYVNRGREALARIVATRTDDGRVWRVWLNFLSRDPRNPQWVKDTQTMLDGLVVNEMSVR